MSMVLDPSENELLGQDLAEIDTPALLIDLDQMEQNIAAMSEYIRGHGKNWRPHAKCHKSPRIALRQIEAGASGVTVAKVSEAEQFAQAGITDILIAHIVVGQPKLRRLVELCKVADPIVCCDHYAQAEMLSQVCATAGVTCRLLIDVNIGMNRTGVRPGPDAIDLVRGVMRLPAVSYAGLMGYEGHLLLIDDPEEKRTAITRAVGLLTEIRDQLSSQGITSDILSAGGTDSYHFTAQCEGTTEIQAGGGIFADPFYTEDCHVPDVQPSLSLIATVVGRPKLDRAILDCGRKSLTPDLHPPRVFQIAGGRPLRDAEITMISAEHTALELGPGSQDLTIGQKVLIRPGYSDWTTLLHDRFYGMRGGTLEQVIPLAARGCLS